jgi:hypothetical protein
MSSNPFFLVHDDEENKPKWQSFMPQTFRLRDMRTVEVSLVDRPATGKRFKIFKRAGDQSTHIGPYALLSWDALNSIYSFAKTSANENEVAPAEALTSVVKSELHDFGGMTDQEVANLLRLAVANRGRALLIQRKAA